MARAEKVAQITGSDGGLDSINAQLRYIYNSYRTALLNQKYYGHRLLWLAISGLATVLGVVKPILNLSGKIETYSKLYAGYSGIRLDLKGIVEDIEVSRSIPSSVLQRYGDIRKKTSDLGGLDDPRPDRGKIKQLQVEVNEEIPPESLWFPSEVKDKDVDPLAGQSAISP